MWLVKRQHTLHLSEQFKQWTSHANQGSIPVTKVYKRISKVLCLQARSGLSLSMTAPFAPLSPTPKTADKSRTLWHQTPAENYINSSKQTTSCPEGFPGRHLQVIQGTGPLPQDRGPCLSHG